MHIFNDKVMWMVVIVIIVYLAFTIMDLNAYLIVLQKHIKI